MKCMVQGCGMEADCAVGINVPAQGVAIDQHQPLRMVLGIALCFHHYDGLTVQEFVTDQLMEIFEVACQTSKRAPPDFHRAYLSKVALDSPEFLSVSKMAEKDSV
jgi:hypothetical protein